MNVTIKNNLAIIKSNKGQPILLLQIADARELHRQLGDILSTKSVTENVNEWRTSLYYDCNSEGFNVWSPKKQT